MSGTLKPIVITMGDPLGIGPEVIVKSLLAVKFKSPVMVVGERAAFSRCRDIKKFYRLKFLDFIETQPRLHGYLPATAAEAALDALEIAVDLIRHKKAAALVTAPVSKERLAEIGFAYPGHTEYLCAAFGVKKHAMLLFHERLRVALTTIHVPFSQVTKLVTQDSVVEKLELLVCSLLRDFKIKAPRVAVCGLNPHAGENGLLGTEEKHVIAPAIKKFLKQAPKNVRVFGPLSADTVFHEALSGKYDAVLCQYHDQGLIPLKTTGFHTGVNMTLGLPFVRTSPDHGTAFDLFGKNRANPGSMLAAIHAAQNFLNHTRSTNVTN